MARKKKFQLTLDIPPKTAEKDRYQGWTNSATWCANLYFNQERPYYEELVRLMKKDGRLDRIKVRMLFNRYMLDKNVSPFDQECEGPVYIEEICNNFEFEYNLTKE